VHFGCCRCPEHLCTATFSQQECRALLTDPALWAELRAEELVTWHRRVTCGHAGCRVNVLLPEGKRPAEAVCPVCVRCGWGSKFLLDTHVLGCHSAARAPEDCDKRCIQDTSLPMCLMMEAAIIICDPRPSI